ncbi:electron transport complex subunit RsxG [Azovibrio restrictus]|uniref:electron transport complex subunit RsxG n=1 Tax=Azovibrio restrictus TaxID=146938 RepID=UPI0026F25D3E|nr:electron transport complex subunit RsxG [Azovibrio restrictus]
MSEVRTYTASTMAVRTALILFVFVVLFTALLAGAYQWTRPAIETSLAAEKMKFINEVLPAGSYDNDLLTDTLRLPPTPELGQKTPSTVYRARRAGQPTALVLEAIAPDGYAGEIRLVLGVTVNGDITGVRVVQHKETPGLGDYIDPRKDKNRESPWISQFAGLNYPQVADAEWKVKKDKGRFDYRTGATVTPRAVVGAVHKAVRFAVTHQPQLFAPEGRP